MSDLKMPSGVALAGGAPARAAMPDDDFSRRMGIALAASLGVNFLLFAGAGLLANSLTRLPDPAPIQISMRPVQAVPTPIATPLPSPSAVPTPVATPIPTPAPVRATPDPVRATPPPPRATPTVRPTPAPTPRLTTTKPVKVASANTITREMERQRNSMRATSPKPLLGTKSGVTFIPKISASTGGAAGAASLAPTATSRTNTTSGRVAAGTASLAAAALNPITTVQPSANSTINGDTRQTDTVRGLATPAKGRNKVVTMSAKASEVSPSAFTFQSGGTVRAGVPTARQGGAGTNAVAAVAGAPTALSVNSEYAVYAPQVESRGLIGIRGTGRAPIGAQVTSLPQKGEGTQFSAGVSGAAIAGAIPGGMGRTATVQGRTGTGTAGLVQGGGPTAKNGGDSAGSSIARGEGRSTGTATTGKGPGSGRGIGKSVGEGVNGDKNARGGTAGEVRGVENGVRGGTPDRTGTVGARVSNGNAKSADNSGAKAKDNVTNNTVGANAQDVKRPPVTINPDVDTSILDLPGRLNAQIGAKPTYKGSFDLPDSLRSTRFKGEVVVRVTVEANGAHSEEIVDGSGNGGLDAAVKSYMRSWRWEAAKQDGKAVRSSTKVNLPIEVK